MKPSIPVALALLALVAPVAGQSEPSGKATKDPALAKPRLSRLQGRAAVACSMPSCSGASGGGTRSSEPPCWFMHGRTHLAST